MFTWPRDRRLPVLAAYTALALAASALVVSGPAEGATGPGEEFFAPRLVTVDTPTRADKERLQTLGLDLTEHAGHDYVEVVAAHAPPTSPRWPAVASPTTSASPT